MKTKLLIFCLVAFATLSNAQSGGTLTVTATTSNPGGQYNPANVVAMWVQNSSGALVNTMLYNTNNGNSSAVDMTVWYGLIKTWTSRNTLKNVDGITGATNNSYGTKTCYWGKTVDISTVPDGVYTVKMEICNGQAAVGSAGHKVAAYTFTKGPAASTGVVSGSASPSFSNVSVQWTSTAAIEATELSKSFSVYPNPATSNIRVKGGDVQEIELLNLAGKSILKTNLTNINISSLPRAAYMLKIKSAQGTVVKRFVKK